MITTVKLTPAHANELIFRPDFYEVEDRLRSHAIVAGLFLKPIIRAHRLRFLLQEVQTGFYAGQSGFDSELALLPDRYKLKTNNLGKCYESSRPTPNVTNLLQP
jgi:hypothetical protein